MIEGIVTGLTVLSVLGAGLAVVLWRNLVHSVLFLAFLLLATAVLFLLLRAPFLAGVQVMLYAGGVVTLMLFAIMLTRRKGGVSVENEVAPRRRLPAAMVSLGLFAVMAEAIHETTDLPAQPAPSPSTPDLAQAFLTDHLLSFEVLSVLLLAATIGAIVIARRRDFGAPPRRLTDGSLRPGGMGAE